MKLTSPSKKANGGTSDGTPFIEIFAFQRYRSQHLLDEGQLQASMDLALELYQIGAHLSELDLSWIDALVFSLAKSMGIEQLQRLAQHPDAKESLLAQMQTRLPVAPPFGPKFASLLKAQYQDMKHRLDTAHTSDALVDNPLEDLGIEEVTQVTGNTIRKNRTLGLHVLDCMPLLEACEQGWPAIIQAMELQHLKIASRKKSRWAQLLNPNAGGEAYLERTVDTISIVYRLLSKDIHTEVLRLQLALRRYELKHDQVPEKLDALLPDSIDALPLDPFDGQPLKWNPKTQRLYSVGWNLTDDGGVFIRPWGRTADSRDLGMEYLWRSSLK